MSAISWSARKQKEVNGMIDKAYLLYLILMAVFLLYLVFHLPL